MSLNPTLFSGLENSLHCPKCETKTRHKYITIFANNDSTYFAIAKCIDCDRLVFFQYEKVEDPNRPIALRVITPLKVKWIFPNISNTNVQDIPKKITKSYLEGVRCLEVNSPNGAVGMFRRALQQTCVNLGADPSAGLKEQIKILPSDVKPTATEIREWGNLGVHEDNKGKIMDVSPKQANAIKRFIERVFLVIFQHPAELKRLQSERK